MGMSNLDEEIRHLREILTKRFIAAGIVTPRILALSQHLDTLIVERQLMDLPKRRILA